MTRMLLLASLLATGGCIGSAQVHEQDAEGGILALDGNEEKALEDARRKMATHCGPAGYEIVGRKRVVVGRQSYEHSSIDYDEQTDRQRNEDTVADGYSDTRYGEQSDAYAEGGGHAYNNPYGSHAYAKGESHERTSGYEEADYGSQTSTQEQETEVTSGQENSSTYGGVENKYETRIHYRCGSARAQR